METKKIDSSQKIQSTQESKKVARHVEHEKTGTLTGNEGSRGIVIKKLEEFKNKIAEEVSKTIKKMDDGLNEKVQEFNKKARQLQKSIDESIGGKVKETFGQPIKTRDAMIQTKFEAEIKSITKLIGEIDRMLKEDVQIFNKKIEEFKKETDELQNMFREMVKGRSNKEDVKKTKKE